MILSLNITRKIVMETVSCINMSLEVTSSPGQDGAFCLDKEDKLFLQVMQTDQSHNKQTKVNGIVTNLNDFMIIMSREILRSFFQEILQELCLMMSLNCNHTLWEI